MSQVTSFSNAAFVHKAKKILEEMGYEMQKKHLHNFFARLCDHPSNHQAAAKKVQFAETVTAKVVTVPRKDPTLKYFEIKVRLGDPENDLELKKYYNVPASSRYQATCYVQDYIRERERQKDQGSDEIQKKKVLSPEIQAFMDAETEEEFEFSNWELIWNEADMKVEWQEFSYEDVWDYFVEVQGGEDDLSFFYTSTEEVARETVIFIMFTLNNSPITNKEECLNFFMQKWKAAQK